MTTRILSSSFSQILNTNPDTGNTIVEIASASPSSGNALGTTPIRYDRTSSISSTTLLVSNVSRVTAAITNESTSILYILYGNTASSTNYTYVLPAIASNIPSTLIVDDYNGIITGVWASANGFARVTEVV